MLAKGKKEVRETNSKHLLPSCNESTNVTKHVRFEVCNPQSQTIKLKAERPSALCGNGKGEGEDEQA